MPRPKGGNGGNQPPPAFPPADKYRHLVSGGTTHVECQACHLAVVDIPTHLKQAHPMVSVEEYQEAYQGAPLRAERAPEPQRPEDLRVTVSPAEAAAHPVGFRGAEIEKTIRDEHHRAMYRENCKKLLEEGFPAGDQLAEMAYQQLQAARLRVQIETASSDTGGYVFDEGLSQKLAQIEARVREYRKELKREVRESLEEQQSKRDPLDVVQDSLREAEDFVGSMQGEFQMVCPSCSMPLLAPGIPHWAFEELRTEHGVQWPVWSREMWAMVLDGTMRVWQMAYALRTSPEGLRQTAGRRGDDWPTSINLEAEEVELAKRLRADDRAFLARARLTGEDK
jgi:hypothetical protein